ncbi:hypothetical protein GGR56DRAFT_258926 [Xylariaceae sp. FL0804]|nr:hypothetical protein GGR56DRAFT_258926 [Xylariaceae sp. FL0804]
MDRLCTVSFRLASRAAREPTGRRPFFTRGVEERVYPSQMPILKRNQDEKDRKSKPEGGKASTCSSCPLEAQFAGPRDHTRCAVYGTVAPRRASVLITRPRLSRPAVLGRALSCPSGPAVQRALRPCPRRTTGSARRGQLLDGRSTRQVSHSDLSDVSFHSHAFLFLSFAGELASHCLPQPCHRSHIKARPSEQTLSVRSPIYPQPWSGSGWRLGFPMCSSGS